MAENITNAVVPPIHPSAIMDSIQFGGTGPNYTWRKGGLATNPEDNHLWLITGGANDAIVPEQNALIEIDPDDKTIKFWGTTSLLDGLEFQDNSLSGLTLKDGSVTSDKLADGIQINGSALTLTNSRSINGVLFNGSSNVINYASCTTPAAAAAKAVNVPNFKLITGATISVKFENAVSANNPTLNVTGSGNKPIFYHGNAIAANSLLAKTVYTFVYDGTNWNVVGDLTTTMTDNKMTQVVTNNDAQYPLVFASEANKPIKVVDGATIVNNSVTVGTNPTSDVSKSIVVTDKSNQSNYTEIVSTVDKSGNVTSELRAKANKVGGKYGALSVISYTNGTVKATAPTPEAKSNDASIATTAWVNDAIDLAQQNVVDQQNYPNIKASGTSVDQGMMYFAKIVPASPLGSSRIKFAFDCTAPFTDYNCSGVCEIIICGNKYSYKYWIDRAANNVIAFEGINVKLATIDTLSNGGGHYIAFSLAGSNNPNIAGYERTFNVVAVESDGCTFELLPKMTIGSAQGITSTTHNADSIVSVKQSGFYYTSTINYGDRLAQWDRLPVAGNEGLIRQTSVVFMDGQNKTTMDASIGYIEAYTDSIGHSMMVAATNPANPEGDADAYVAIEYAKSDSNWVPSIELSHSPATKDSSMKIATTKYVQDNLKSLEVIDGGVL